MNYRDLYQQQGYLSPFDVIDEYSATSHRRALEQAEEQPSSVH